MDPHQRESVRRGAKRAFVIRERSVDEASQFFQRYFSTCGFMGGSRHEAHHFVEEARSGKGDEDMFPCLCHLCLRDGSAEVTLRNRARFIAAQGGGRKGDLSRFIEEAVRAHLLERAAEQAKTAAAGMSETQLTDLIDEAVQWAREH